MSRLLRGQQNSVRTLSFRDGDSIARIPHNFMGLSYESVELGNPNVFSAKNRKLIAAFRKLTPAGVLRLGGNTSEFTYFKSSEKTPVPAYRPLPGQPGSLTPITVHAIEELRDFLDASDWTCIFGLNLGTGTPERAAEEAIYAARILGSRLQYFQIGNEPNNYIRYRLRSASWNADAFLDEWLSFARAILSRVPHARLGGPDMGADPEWFKVFADRAAPALGSSLAELTDHFYAEGPPTSPSASVTNLLFNTKIDREIRVMQTNGKIANRPYRMTEVNSCYMGGKPGISDTFAAALWAGDLSLRLLASGFSGVNFHGGNAQSIKASLGGTLPGENVAKAAVTDSYYTPIAGDSVTGYSERPIFYGMAAAARAAGGDMLRVLGTDASLRAYAVQKDSTLELFLFNVAPGAITVRLDGGALYKVSMARMLCAASVDSTAVTEKAADVNGMIVTVPGTTALQLTLVKS